MWTKNLLTMMRMHFSWHEDGLCVCVSHLHACLSCRKQRATARNSYWIGMLERLRLYWNVNEIFVPIFRIDKFINTLKWWLMRFYIQMCILVEWKVKIYFLVQDEDTHTKYFTQSSLCFYSIAFFDMRMIFSHYFHNFLSVFVQLNAWYRIMMRMISVNSVQLD